VGAGAPRRLGSGEQANLLAVRRREKEGGEEQLRRVPGLAAVEHPLPGPPAKANDHQRERGWLLERRWAPLREVRQQTPGP